MKWGGGLPLGRFILSFCPGDYWVTGESTFYNCHFNKHGGGRCPLILGRFPPISCCVSDNRKHNNSLEVLTLTRSIQKVFCLEFCLPIHHPLCSFCLLSGKPIQNPSAARPVLTLSESHKSFLRFLVLNCHGTFTF